MMLPSRRLLTFLFGFVLMPIGLSATSAEEPKRSTPSRQAGTKPLKVFILAGQSNMQGHASISTFDSMTDDPKTVGKLADLDSAVLVTPHKGLEVGYVPFVIRQAAYE